MTVRLTTEEFISRSQQIHKNEDGSPKYDYSKSMYDVTYKKVIIICALHGEFLQTPYHHLKGSGCQKCGFNKISLLLRSSVSDFIKNATLIHENKYDYSKINYIDKSTRILIKCPIHGEFLQKPREHIIGIGCVKCAGNYSPTTEEFINKAIKIHGNKYNYSKVKYINAFKDIIIICPSHGEFKQRPHNHIKGSNCPKCSKINTTFKNRSTINKFIEKARKIHGNRYDYSKSIYITNKTKLMIECPEHGIFEQTPGSHIIQKYGCPVCNESQGEKKIRIWLDQNNINFEPQKRFKDCRDKFPLPFDFYLPDHNIIIEFDGPQHFSRKYCEKYYGGEYYDILKKHDRMKSKYCKKNKIKLVRIPYWDYNKIEEILNNLLVNK